MASGYSVFPAPTSRLTKSSAGDALVIVAGIAVLQGTAKAEIRVVLWRRTPMNARLPVAPDGGIG